MVAAFTFPGQGSQAVGMGKALFEQFAQAREVFQEVDDALGEKLSTIMFEDPDNVLTLTRNAQPALMAVSMALIRVMEAQGLDIAQKISFVAGHSLGEYSALCAARMFTLADTARLLRIRGDAMQAAVGVGEGAMAAIIGLEYDDVDSICRSVVEIGACQVANDNGGGQLVISGMKLAVEKAAAIALEKGAKRALLLPVSAPFHSSLMQPAADTMRQALGDVQKTKPIVPVVANVTVAPEQDVATICNLLVEQVTGQVRWRETIMWFAGHEVDTIYEIGSGKVLTGLAKRINKDILALTINSGEDIEKVLKALDV